MTRCLRDKTLLMLLEGDGTDKQRSHLESCEACGERYKQMRRDLDLIRHALVQDPSPSRVLPPPIPLFYRWIPAAAALAVGIALGWGQSWVWRADSLALSPRASDIELSQFLDDVSEAIFAGTNVRTTSAASSDSDFALLQVALGESCSYECEQVYSNSAVETRGSPPKDRSRRGTEHKVQEGRE